MQFKSILQVFTIGACCALGVTATPEDAKVGSSREWRNSRMGRRRSDNETTTTTIPAAMTSAIEIPGLINLQSYVCPSSSNKIARQVSVGSGSTAMSVPITDLLALFQAVQALVAQLEVVLQQQGLLSPTLAAGGMLPVVATSYSTVISTTPGGAQGTMTVPVLITVKPSAAVAVGTQAAAAGNAGGQPQLVMEGSGGVIYVTVTSTTTVWADSGSAATTPPDVIVLPTIPAEMSLATTRSPSLATKPAAAPFVIVVPQVSSPATTAVAVAGTTNAAAQPMITSSAIVDDDDDCEDEEEEDDDEDCEDEDDAT